MKSIAFLLLITLSAFSCSDSSSGSDGDSSSPTRIGNSNTMVFHTTDCYYIGQIKAEHKVSFANRDAAIKAGYSADASGKCKP